eukprot:TRINITY_DN1911_c0_g1_i2.p1 TRINITY_DN1911_c0_g1~~TRINITY_DN1911_c0_g1_i2.p1  ORF type:complete len:620 (-),score=128.12 TRINITY_DN1911_c0_g1_i2:2094-3953(-)
MNLTSDYSKYMESTTELIQQLIAAPSLNEKLAVLQRLKTMASDKGFVIANTKRLFNELKSLVATFTEASIPTIEFLTTLITTNKDPEVYTRMPTIYPVLVSTLSSSNNRLIESTNSCLCGSVCNSIGLDSFLVAIQADGLSCDNAVGRKNSGELLVALAKKCPQLIDEAKYGSQLVRILEELVKRPNEFSGILGQLTQTHPAVYKLSRKLYAPFKAAYNSLLVKENIQINESDPSAYKEMDDALTAEISKKFTFAQNFEARPETRYGAVPERLLRDLEAVSNWKQRAGAIEELLEIVVSPSSYTLLRPHIVPLMNYLVTLLADPNYKVAVTTLQIINKLLQQYQEFYTGEGVEALIPGLVDKLGDNKVMIRQLAIAGLRKVGKIMEIELLLSVVLPYLASPKWHTREEILNFLIIALIENGGDAKKPFDEIKLVEEILPLLCDDKPKVVQMAFEVYATIAQSLGAERILDTVKARLKDDELVSRLRYRLEAGEVPVLSAEGTLEFPHISSELITQNSFYSGAKGKGYSRFTSAGPVNRVPERSHFEIRSAVRRPQTNNTLVFFPDAKGSLSVQMADSIRTVTSRLVLATTAPHKKCRCMSQSRATFLTRVWSRCRVQSG